MRLHTSLTYEQVEAAIARAKKSGRVHPSIYPVDTNEPGAMTYRNMSQHGSRTHARAFEIQLESGHQSPIPETVNRYGRTQKTRRRSQNGAWAATWREWGWVMAEVFAADPNARFGSGAWGYDGVQDFNEKTDYEFDLDDDDYTGGELRSLEGQQRA